MMRHQAIGGQLLECECLGHSLFYCSPLSEPGKMARGGVPICFPQFGTLGSLPKHGYARHQSWTLLEDGPHKFSYALDIRPGEWSDWPYKAKVEITHERTVSGLVMTLSVKNIDNVPFSFTAGIHPYFQLGSLVGSSLHGLEGLKCKNLFDAEQKQKESNSHTFNESAFETCFEGPVPLQVQEKGRVLFTLKSSGFTHWMAWNPGKDGALLLHDLPEGDWNKFLCIEPILAEPYVLQAKEDFVGALEILVNQ